MRRPGQWTPDTPEAARQRKLRTELRSVEALRATSRRQPSLMTANLLIKRLWSVGSGTGEISVALDKTVRGLLDRTRELAKAYVRESSRESWRKPHPSVWAKCMDNTLRAADLIETTIRQNLAAPPLPAHAPHDDAFGEVFDDDYEYDPFEWTGCWQGTIRLRPSDEPQAVVVRSVERALEEGELTNARVTASDDHVELLWPPDEHEPWERDLVVDVLERASATVGLPPSVVHVRWRRPRH